jgi:hypothetical protein
MATGGLFSWLDPFCGLLTRKAGTNFATWQVPARLDMKQLRVLTWNIAAINNNPFEYWLTHPDPDYAVLMESVEKFIESPGERDVCVKDVFTVEMYADLKAKMDALEWEGDDGCAAFWEELSERKIVQGFLKDEALGSKRLMSMPDRFTNTIDIVGDATACRPTVISSFEGDMSTTSKWFDLWLAFMFDQKVEIPGKKGAPAESKAPCALLSKIPRAKYPALTEHEEACSRRLQTLCLAAFDAILVHMLNTLSPDGKWLELKASILAELTKKKEAKQIAMLQGVYHDADILFLQEVKTTAYRTTLPGAFSERYSVHGPAKPSKADQNSCILLSTARFAAETVVDLSAQAMDAVPKEGPAISDGDLFVISASDAAGHK